MALLRHRLPKMMCMFCTLSWIFLLSLFMFYYKVYIGSHRGSSGVGTRHEDGELLVHQTVVINERPSTGGCNTTLPELVQPCPQCPELVQPCPQCPETVHTCKPAKHACPDILINHSRCPINKPFLVYIYNSHTPDFFSFNQLQVLRHFESSLRKKQSLTSNASKACVFILLIGYSTTPSEKFEQHLQRLPHWHGTGQNHLLIEVSTLEQPSRILSVADTSNAIVANTYVTAEQQHCPHILAPPILSVELPEFEDPQTDPLDTFSINRSYLLYFEGAIVWKDAHKEGQRTFPHHLDFNRRLNVKVKVNINPKCTNIVPGALDGEWSLCGTLNHRIESCSQSNFSLVLGGTHGEMGVQTYTRLIESLRCGAIPVVVGIDRLPFDEVINWHRAAILLPALRLRDVVRIISSVRTESIIEYRRQGRFLLETYFTSEEQVLDMVVAMVRSKSLHPPPPAADFAGTMLASKGPGSLFPPSPRFLNNFSVYTEELWNSPPGPFYMYPVTPFRSPYYPSMTWKPVRQKQNTTGDEVNVINHFIEGLTLEQYREQLHGHYSHEGFTLVTMTYHRNERLLEFLASFEACPYLAKVVVVWNNEEDPPSNMTWPDIGVPVEVVRAGRNSLNNRFLPLTNIETEAILSLDNDQELSHEDIEFAFRVWRENRDRIVGWVARYHHWDEGGGRWLYGTGLTCQVSMALTGAAMFHKYFSYVYSYWMPQRIREMVDERMNCEDIAMNFLIAHISKKPPIKMDSKVDLHCRDCHSGLSTTRGHYEERDTCINLFARAWGYTPLLWTQMRAEPTVGNKKCFPNSL